MGGTSIPVSFVFPAVGSVTVEKPLPMHLILFAMPLSGTVREPALGQVGGSFPAVCDLLLRGDSHSEKFSSSTRH